MISRGKLIVESIKLGAKLTNTGALSVLTHPHTGRSPSAKRTVKDRKTKDSVDWNANLSMSPVDFQSLKSKAKNYSDSLPRLYTQTVIAGKDPGLSIKVTIHCERPEHALFVQNMFQVYEGSKESDLTVWSVPDMIKDDPVVALNFSSNEVVISGTRYAGEIKKSVFTFLNYCYPTQGVLPMHCSVNTPLEKGSGTPTVFFGLSGTGKTTLSADSDRMLLGDDEHGWGSKKIFNFENGCYAKTIGLTEKSEPEIYRAASMFGSILENVKIKNFAPDYDDDSHTQNGRVSYPLTHIENTIESGVVSSDPGNVVMLTCDAFGVLPAVSKLSSQEARDQFLIGYTAKVAGTEKGVTEPVATFSPCFGAPFMPMKPSVYGALLEKKIQESGANCWLVNTGWFGGPPGVGARIGLDITRRIITMINDGTLAKIDTEVHELSGYTVPVTGEIPVKYTQPHRAWDSYDDYVNTLEKLLKMMQEQLNNEHIDRPFDQRS